MAGYVNGPQAAEWGRQRFDIEGEWPPVVVDLLCYDESTPIIYRW